MRTRSKLPPVRCRHRAKFGKLSPSPARRVSGASAAVPPAQRIAAGVPPAGEAQRGPAVHAGARAQRGRRLGAGCVSAARRRRKPFQRRPPRLHGAGRARRLRPRISACRRGPDPQPECERAVSSGRRQWARSGGGCIFERGRAASSPGGALGGWPRQPEPRQTSKSPTDCWATWRGGDRAGCRVRRRTSARLRRAEVLKAISAQSQSLYTTTAPARLRGVTRLIWDRKNGKITLLAAFRLGSISDRVVGG